MVGDIILITIAGIIIYSLRKSYKEYNRMQKEEYAHWVKNAKMVHPGTKWEVRLVDCKSPFIPRPHGIVKELKKDEEGTPWVKVALYTGDNKFMHEEAIRLSYRYTPQFFDRFKYKV